MPTGSRTWRTTLDLGIEDLACDAITMVEWGDRIAGAYPEYLSVALEHVPSRGHRPQMHHQGLWPAMAAAGEPVT